MGTASSFLGVAILAKHNMETDSREEGILLPWRID